MNFGDRDERQGDGKHKEPPSGGQEGGANLPPVENLMKYKELHDKALIATGSRQYKEAMEYRKAALRMVDPNSIEAATQHITINNLILLGGVGQKPVEAEHHLDACIKIAISNYIENFHSALAILALCVDSQFVMAGDEKGRECCLKIVGSIHVGQDTGNELVEIGTGFIYGRLLEWYERAGKYDEVVKEAKVAEDFLIKLFGQNSLSLDCVYKRCASTALKQGRFEDEMSACSKLAEVLKTHLLDSEGKGKEEISRDFVECSFISIQRYTGANRHADALRVIDGMIKMVSDHPGIFIESGVDLYWLQNKRNQIARQSSARNN